MFLFFSIPKEMKPFFNEDVKKSGLSKRAFLIDLIYFYYKGRLDQKKRTDYYNSIGRQ